MNWTGAEFEDYKKNLDLLKKSMMAAWTSHQMTHYMVQIKQHFLQFVPPSISQHLTFFSFTIWSVFCTTTHHGLSKSMEAYLYG